PGDERRPDGAEVARGRRAVVGHQAALALLAGAGRGVGAVPVRVVVEREVRDGARRGDAGDRAERRLDLADEVDAASVGRVAAGGDPQLEGEEVLPAEARVDALDRGEGADEEAGSGEEDEAERHLRDDEEGAGAAARRAEGAAPVRPEGVGEIDAASLE